MIIALVLVAAYLLGSVSGSLVVGRWRGVDIRTQGSGNAGGTNALRTQGWRFALATVLIDVGKGVAAAGIATALGFHGGWILASVAAAMAGHVWPVFHGFRGGKGAATLVGGLLVAWPLSLLPVLGGWLLCLVTTGYVGLSTVLAGWLLLPFALWQDAGFEAIVFSAAVGGFLTWTHRSNLQRLRAGSEHRFERARLFSRKPGRPPS